MTAETWEPISAEQSIKAGLADLDGDHRLKTIQQVGTLTADEQDLIARTFLFRTVVVGVDTGGDGSGIKVGRVAAIGSPVDDWRTRVIVLIAEGHPDRASVIPLAFITMIDEAAR